ncbi:hypothetical protein [Demequina aurantiaca]|uniref:hypothetical protein n=1 Tax=Demequina aurantiaca TaxID=676200 RepID=UPI0007839BBC|nr:hypothetical protein [Demequina aurantiaca]
MSSVATRPASVTFVVVLMWIFALGSIVGGVLVLTRQIDLSAAESGGDGTAYAWGSIFFGVIMALLAMALARGSRIMRVLIIIVMLVRIATDVYAWFAVSNPPVFQLGLSIAFALLIILLLSTKRAGEFFRR